MEKYSRRRPALLFLLTSLLSGKVMNTADEYALRAMTRERIYGELARRLVSRRCLVVHKL